VYEGDLTGDRVRLITPTGLVSTFVGSGTSNSVDGTGEAASIDDPSGLAVDTSGNVFITDNNHHKIRKSTSSGVVTTLAGSGTSGGTNAIGISASFNVPTGLTLNSDGTILYVTEQSGNRIRAVVVSTAVVTTLAGTGSFGYSDSTTGTLAVWFVPVAFVTVARYKPASAKLALATVRTAPEAVIG
jgi:sugar lactone lactonase YvrE